MEKGFENEYEPFTAFQLRCRSMRSFQKLQLIYYLALFVFLSVWQFLDDAGEMEANKKNKEILFSSKIHFIIMSKIIHVISYRSLQNALIFVIYKGIQISNHRAIYIYIYI